MRLPPFRIERYFDRHEFTAPALLCASDCEAMRVGEVLALEPGTAEAFQATWLGYTESPGAPSLRTAIAATYRTIGPDEVLVHAGAEEAIFTFANGVLEPGDHVVVQVPCYQSLNELPGAAGCEVTLWQCREAGTGGLAEIDAARRLAAIRGDGELFRDASFPTISGAGPNGAIVHYHATPTSNRRLEAGTLYLVDSGAQYLDGTTDVTRTVAIGAPDAEMRDRFTRVLKGHIAIATARFPAGTTGAQLDTLARQPLWQVGLDYDHGTGHGVGSYLGVHEGPQRISKPAAGAALKPGMIVSNEPGYYKTGAYGIRIENLVTVIALPRMPEADRDMLGFETLTLAPIDANLVDPALLSAEEIAWLDAYHARVCERLTPLLDADTARWLDQATRPVGG